MLKIFNRREKESDWYDVFLISQKKPNHIYFKELAIDHAIDLIARTVSKSEINFYQNIEGSNRKIKDDLYYKLNIKPNPKQTGTDFMYELVDTLFRDGNVLVVPKNEHLYIAYSFEVESKLDGYIYKNVKIVDATNKEFELKETFTSDEVMHLHLKNTQVTNVLENFYQEFAEMISASIAGFKNSNYKKSILKLPTNITSLKMPDGEKIDLKDYTEAITDGLLEDGDGVVALGGAFDLEELGQKGANKEQISDYIKLLKTYADSVAMAFNIPLDVYYGEQTERADGMNNFLTFAIMPVIEIIEDGLNSTFISKESYLNNEHFRFDRYSMKHFDVTDIASSLDKLFAIGWSHNDLREIVGLPQIEDEFADERYVTKNYMSSAEQEQEVQV